MYASFSEVQKQKQKIKIAFLFLIFQRVKIAADNLWR